MEESIIIPDNLPIPNFNPDRQYLGEPTFNEQTKEWFFPVIDYSENDLKAIKIYKAEFDRQKALSIESENKILEESFILSESDSLEKQAIFQIWEKLELGYQFEVGKKYQSFDGEELKLFSVIQPHKKQIDYVPIKVPNLFNLIVIQNGIEVWKQPIGGNGKYVFDSVVTHKGFTWKNTHPKPNLNVWEPGVFGWKQI